MKKRFLFIVLLIFACSGCTENAYFNQYLYPENKAEPASTDALSGRTLWRGNSSLPEVALTFDDGPSSKYTSRVLDILRDNDVKATFFVQGRFIEKNNALLRRESQEGHIIGNHTYTHSSGKISDFDKIKRELERTDSLITKYTGQKVKYFRPPFGFENWRYLSAADAMGYHTVLWTFDISDWNNHKTEKDIINRINKQVGNGAIILLHDGGISHEAMLSALPIIIKTLRAKGYNFVRIDEMISHL